MRSFQAFSVRTAVAAIVALLFGALAVPSRADSSDISLIALGRVKLFLQLGPADPFVETQPFGFAAGATAVAPGRITSGMFTYSGPGPILPLSSEDNTSFNFGQRFATLADLNAAFPAGTYYFDIFTVTPPTEVFAQVDLTGSFPLTIPKLANTQWRSVVLQFDSRSDFTFVSNTFADFRYDSVHGSQVELMISDIFNNMVLDQYDDTAPTNTLTVAGGRLTPGIYVGRLMFAHVDQTTPGVSGLGDFNANMTEFIISAVDGPPVVTNDTITVNAGQLFVYAIDATNLPSQFSATNLPPGNVKFDAATGLIGGYPTTGGTYVVNLSANNVVGTGTGTLTVNVQQSSLAITSSTRAAGRIGTPFRFQVLCPGATAAARLTATGLPAGLRVDAASGQISGTPTQEGDFLVQLQVTDTAATAKGVLLISLDNDPAFPAITSPTSVNIAPGQNFTYRINAAPISNQASSGLGTNAADAPTYSLIGDLPAGLTFDAKTGTISGVYQGHPQRDADTTTTRLSGGALVGNVQINATNSRGTSTVPLAFFNSPTGAVNISTRMAIANGDNVLIGGFIVTGNAPKKLLVRALGPSLPVAGAVQDPMLEIHGSDGTLITNDDWKSNDAQSVIDSQVPPTDDREAAVVGVFQPNVNYTAIVKGKNGATGVALVELYDLGTAALDASSTAKLANISTRGLVQTGDNVMIGGFIISQVQSKVIARAIGPSLAQAGVSNALPDTLLELHGPNGELVAANDDWQSDPAQAQQITATGVPPTDARESAVVATLNPGNYTAVVKGKNNAIGVGLVEVYALQ